MKTLQKGVLEDDEAWKRLGSLFVLIGALSAYSYGLANYTVCGPWYCSNAGSICTYVSGSCESGGYSCETNVVVWICHRTCSEYDDQGHWIRDYSEGTTRATPSGCCGACIMRVGSQVYLTPGDSLLGACGG